MTRRNRKTVEMTPEEPRPDRLLGVTPGPRVTTTSRELSEEARRVIARDRANEVRRIRKQENDAGA